MVTNKHVLVAMLVAPVLAILAWFAVDFFLSERPHVAKPGASYMLIPRSNCRYASGQCDLENGEFELLLEANSRAATTVTLIMRAKYPLQQATIGFIDGSNESAPSPMASTDAEALRWSATLALPSGEATMLGLVVSADGVNYFAEVPTTFMRAGR